MAHRFRDHVERLHRERTEQPQQGQEPVEDAIQPRPYVNNAGEAEVVPLFQLSPILRKWRDEFEAEHDQKDPNMAGPLTVLSEHTGIPVRTISAIMKEEKKRYKGGMVALSVADALLQAAGLFGVLYDQVQVVPNPNWTTERWIEYMRERGCA